MTYDKMWLIISVVMFLMFFFGRWFIERPKTAKSWSMTIFVCVVLGLVTGRIVAFASYYDALA